MDVNQVPIEAPLLVGQYGEMALYITAFTDVSRQPLAAENLVCRYLGPQMSLVFFQELLDRYHLLRLEDEASPQTRDEDKNKFEEAGGVEFEETEDEEEDAPADGVAAFQDRYDEVIAQYHPLGFPLGAYEAVPLLETPLGTFFLGVAAAEQIGRVARPGEEVFVSSESFLLASFKQLRGPLFRL